MTKNYVGYWMKNNNSNLMKGGFLRKMAFIPPLRKRGAGGDFIFILCSKNDIFILDFSLKKREGPR
jgi:hypothetical protein